MRKAALLLAAALALPGQTPGLRVTALDAGGATLELATPKPTLTRLHGPRGAVDRVRVKGWGLTTEAGHPELPVAGMLIPVPAAGLLGCDILKETRSTRKGLRIPMVPGPGHGPAAAQGRPDDLEPADLVEVSAPMTVAGETVVRVLFHPFRWRRRTRELQISEALVARLRFAPAPAQARPPGALEPEASPQPAAAEPPAPPVAETPAPPPANPVARDPGAILPALPAHGSAAITAAPAAAVTAMGAMAATAAGGTAQAPDWQDSQRDSMRIEVTRTGLYRIPYEALPLPALNGPVLLPGDIRLTCQGQDVPVRVVAANGHGMAPGDFFEFYGQGLNAIFSGTNVYRLSWAGGGTRPLVVEDADPGGQAPTVTTFQDALHQEQNTVWWALTPGAPAADFWFWSKLLAPTEWTGTFTLPAVGTGAATLAVTYQGWTDDASVAEDHHTQVLLNGTLVADNLWDGQTVYVQTAQLAEGLLLPGANTLALNLPGDTGASVDGVFLNCFDVAWPRAITAVNDAVLFTVQATGPQVIQAGGFSTQDILLYDVTDPSEPLFLSGGAVAPANGAYQLTFADTLGTSRTYFATTGAQCLTPNLVAVWPPSGLKRSLLNGADYLLITPRAFLAAAEPLIELRQSQGLRAVGVATEDIFGEFANGLSDPQAIQDFLTYAYGNWIPPAPRYVLLLGDATQDYHDYYGYGKVNQVPPHLSVTTELGLTPDDNWYVTLGLAAEMPTMAIGRLPAASAGAASAQVQKVIAYEQSAVPASANALFVSDYESIDFQAGCEILAGMLPAAMTADPVYLTPATLAATAHTQILAAFDGGLDTAVYFGHGNTTFWTQEIFQSSDVPLLTNATQLPFLLSFDCLNGYFAIHNEYCLCETLVAAPGGGAIATFASSGLGYTWEHELLGEAIFTSLFQNGQVVVGEICTQAKLTAFGEGATLDMVRMFGLLGDPAMKLKAHP